MQTPGLVIAALLAVQVLFGVSYVVSKVVVDAIPPLVWASLRLIIAATAMMAFAYLSRRPHPEKTRAFFIGLLPLAFFGILINQGFFLLGLHYTTPSNSAIINTLCPIFTLALVTLAGRERPSWRKGAGFLTALAGVLALRHAERFDLSDQTLLGDGLTLINVLSYSVFLAFGKSFSERYDRVWTTAWLFTYGAIAMTLVALPQWLAFTPPPLSARLEACMAIAVVGGTILTYFLNLWALAFVRSSSVAFFVYLQPIVTSLLAWGWLGQAPALREAIAYSLVLGGFWVSLERVALKSRREEPGVQRTSAKRSSAEFRSSNAS